eukprot:scaffold3459_cov119-Isochrysis_galbana.AAC.1
MQRARRREAGRQSTQQRALVYATRMRTSRGSSYFGERPPSRRPWLTPSRTTKKKTCSTFKSPRYPSAMGVSVAR